MSKFANWLNENRSKTLNEEEAIKLLQNKCSQALKKWQDKFRIFRSTRQNDNFVLTVPSGDRESRFAPSNHYTLILNNHPDWKAFPKREIICAGGGGERAFHHGNRVYWVFPYDGAKIGICPSDDIWHSFEDLKVDFDLVSLVELNHRLNGVVTDANWNLFKKEAIETPITEIFDSNLLDDLNVSLYDFITKYMNPKKNGFKLKNINNYDINYNNDLEVWTDTPCVLVSFNVYTEDLLNSL